MMGAVEVNSRPGAAEWKHIFEGMLPFARYPFTGVDGRSYFMNKEKKLTFFFIEKWFNVLFCFIC